MPAKFVLMNAVGVAILTLAQGCGAAARASLAPLPVSSHAATRPKGGRGLSPTASGLHVVRAGPYTLVVPRHWTLGHQIQLNALAASNGMAVRLMPNLVPSSGHGIVSRLNRSPFFSEQLNGAIQGDVSLSVNELTGTGAYYTLTITVPANEHAQLTAAAYRLKTPPPATVTQDAHLIQTVAEKSPQALYYTAAHVGMQDEWILVGGNPATAQEPFALYRSTDGGRHWTLPAYTTFRGRAEFLGLAGLPSIYFWNGHGIIAESSSFAQGIPIAYTTDGGTHWRAARAPHRGEPTAQHAPIITRSANGVLHVTAAIFPDKTVTLQSADNGKTWAATSLTLSDSASLGPIVYTLRQQADIARVGKQHGLPQVLAPTQGIGATFKRVTSYPTATDPPYPVIAITYSNFAVQEARRADALSMGGDHTVQSVTFTMPGIGPVHGTWSFVYGHANTPQRSVLQFSISGMVVQMSTSGTDFSELQMVQMAKSSRVF